MYRSWFFFLIFLFLTQNYLFSCQCLDDIFFLAFIDDGDNIRYPFFWESEYIWLNIDFSLIICENHNRTESNFFDRRNIFDKFINKRKIFFCHLFHRLKSFFRNVYRLWTYFKFENNDFILLILRSFYGSRFGFWQAEYVDLTFLQNILACNSWILLMYRIIVDTRRENVRNC